MATSIYLIGSLRNPKIPLVANTLREAGHDVFDDWYSAGERADDYWKEYEAVRGRSYAEAIAGRMAEHVFGFDYRHLQRCRVAVLVLPGGKSAHMEFGWCIGQMKRCYVLFEEEPDKDRWDLMYKLAQGVVFDVDELVRRIG